MCIQKSVTYSYSSLHVFSGLFDSIQLSSCWKHQSQKIGVPNSVSYSNLKILSGVCPVLQTVQGPQISGNVTRQLMHDLLGHWSTRLQSENNLEP